MQILANALPGFRDLRAPVVAGYAWLIFGWLIVQPDLSRRPLDSIGGSLYDLGQHVGHVGVAIAMSVAAYFVGSLSQTLSAGLRTVWSWLLEQLWYALPSGLDDAIGIIGSPEPPEADEISEIAQRTMTALAAARRSPDAENVNTQASRAYVEARAELALPATLLVGKQPELFAEVDRLRAEGELRLAAIPPFVGLVVLLSCTSSHWYLIALVPVVALLDQGVRRLNSSRQLVADAKGRGFVPSQAVQRFRTWADAVEAKPETMSQLPRARERHVVRELSEQERLRIEQLSTFPAGDPGVMLATLRGLAREARAALVEYAEDERRYAGTGTTVGLTFPPVGMTGDVSRVAALRDQRLIAPRAPGSQLWVLTDDGIAVARLLTAPPSEDPAVSRELEVLRPS